MIPNISVIVPVYNTEKYLDRCIQSILTQTYTDFELLLIDDGSTDSSGAICDKYAEQDSRVRVFHKENGGASSARNLGLDNANGEWITFCDSDDWVYPCWLENYDITNNSTYDLVCQGIECSNKLSHSDKSNKYSFDFTGTIRDGLLLLKEYNVIGYTVIKLFKRDVIEKYNIQFDDHLKFKEDEAFVLNFMMYCETMLSINKIGYYYYVPDWETKYERIVLDLEHRLNMYKYILAIYNDENNILTDRYLLDLVGYVITQYRMNNCKYKLLRAIWAQTRGHIHRLNQLSFVTRYVWTMSPLILHIYLIIKSKMI